ncbi:hypothetical protein QEH56_11120 [Pelagicoccus enzymogenes]|uniref:hypothetical protein n=1 Tax=Pelagicoccus enzymogenes TaxID=2773457 RepID=UPI00280E80C9|nr:hypothetical protein [Pelagicoccus enzymogenes]MDQ8198705.1 hypothetical protein [Pelagicoccus enzymogenes]
MIQRLTKRIRHRWTRRHDAAVSTQGLSQHLRTTIHEVESVFRGISNNLELIDEKTKRLREDCNVLLASAGGHDESSQLLFRVAEALEGPMTFLTGCLQHHAKNHQLMLDSQKSAGDLLQMQNDMVSSLEPLKFMLVFFKIEASQLSEENRQTFHSVSEEISHLHILVDETFQKNIKNLQDARSAILTAEKHTKTEREHQSQLISQKQAEISDAIQAFKTQINTNSKKSAHLDIHANNFENAIGRLVMSLQYEDIIRQRCESILKDLEQKPEGISQASWLIFQATQVETAAEEIRQSSHELNSGLNAISSQAKELYRAATTMDQFEHITASADGMVQMLLESLESIRTMLAQSTALSQGSREAIQPVRELTKELSAVVFEVSIKIQFIALNAQVRSIQVGEGSGLEVLAARTAEISSELRALGDSTATQIDTLHAAVEELVQTIDSEWDAGKEHLATIEEQGPELEAELHALRDSTLNSLQIVASLSEMVTGFSNDDAERLHKLSLQADTLDQFAQELRQQAKIDKLKTAARQAIDAEVETLLSEKRGAMHTRIHNDQQSQAFDLGISTRLSDRANSSKTLSCDNIDLF